MKDIETNEELENELENLVLNHTRLMDDRKKEEVLETIHVRSPSRQNTEQFLEQLFRTYRLKTECLDFRIVGFDDDYVYARARQKTVKIEGPDFKDNISDSLIICRREDSDWKIWLSQPLEISFVE